MLLAGLLAHSMMLSPPPPQTPPPACDGYEDRPNMDMQSDDEPLPDLGPTSSDLDCCEQCNQEPTCAGFVFYANFCYFKGVRYTFSYKAGRVSRTRMPSEILSPPPTPPPPHAPLACDGHCGALPCDTFRDLRCHEAEAPSGWRVPKIERHI